MALIQLTQGKKAIVDNDNLSWLLKYKWSYSLQRGARRTEYPSNKIVSMARAIMGFPKNMEVDHINGNHLDNRRKNLRIATHAQNCMNSRKKRRTFRYKQVYKLDRNLKKPWRARIKLNYKTIHIGYFRTAKEAALAYDQKAKKSHGQFANLNFKL